MADTEIESSSLDAIIASEIRQAQTFDQSKRTAATKYMRGEMDDMPARPNGSSQTDRTLADNISWTLPGVVRVFAASDQMVQFEATQEGGEQAAEEASEYTNYSFFRENDGYRILYNATYDSLLFGNGAVASYWCPEETKTKLFKDKTEEELAYLITEEGWQGVGKPPKPGKPMLVETDMGPMEVPTYTVRLQQVTERGQIKDMSLKPENLLLNGSATTIENARFAAYLHDDKTRSDLMAMADEYGWDQEAIRNMPSYSRRGDQTEVGDARRRGASAELTDASPVSSGDVIDLYECYVRADEDGDGEAELLQVWYAGNAGSGMVLSHEEWECDVPFTDVPCYPVPHQWEADGFYDRSADTQRVKTALKRQLLDNVYSVGLPQMEVEEGSVLNPDALVNRRFGGLLWKKRGTAPIIPHVIPFIGDKLMLALTYADEENAKRTGISRATMALDPEALQNQTATASQNQRDAGYSQIELIARNMAELGWVKFFAKRRNLAKKYIKEPVKIPSRNGDVQQGQTEGATAQASKFRTIQPEKWGDDMACTINVGLGTGSRDRDMSMLNLILNGQIGMADRLANMGMAAKAIEFIPKIRKTAVEMAESSGLKNPDEYYPDFTNDEMQAAIQAAMQPKPDPALALEQAKAEVAMQIEQVKGQSAQQLKQVDAQVAMQQAQLKAEGDIVKNKAELEADMATREADRQTSLIMERQKAQAELAKQERELAYKEWETQFKAQQEAAARQAQTELELLKIGAQQQSASMAAATKSAEDGEAKKKAKDAPDLQTIMSGLQAALSAPKRIVRDADGRAIGVETA